MIIVLRTYLNAALGGGANTDQTQPYRPSAMRGGRTSLCYQIHLLTSLRIEFIDPSNEVFVLIERASTLPRRYTYEPRSSTFLAILAKGFHVQTQKGGSLLGVLEQLRMRLNIRLRLNRIHRHNFSILTCQPTLFWAIF